MTAPELTSELIRAARALLRWEQRDLADSSGVSLGTIKRLEAKPGPLGAHGPTEAALRRALEAAGVEFTNGGEPGVKMRAPVRRPAEDGAEKDRRPAASAKASDMAAQQIDKLVDPGATDEERQTRKRRLLKGPKEFRDIRGDLPKAKR